ncbi:MAG: hypothetical protein IGR92_03475 [Leptolyngbyaceae cyanobacterium T60_A2020_046]|nr:hypothetical protein [Leptolyngbyaceae cyanobacterium T60_A2020_046]
MGQHHVWRGMTALLVLVGAVSMTGCPEELKASVSLGVNRRSATTISQTAILAEPDHTAVPNTVAFEVCANFPDWTRPAADLQAETLAANPRYQGMLNEEPLRSLSEKFWQESIISFTTYGLSARMEPIYLSGVWTIADEIWGCYEGDRGAAINRGELAEVWLINHRIVDVAWVENTYLLTVEPTTQGIQLMQFERQEANDDLPLMVTARDGQAIAAVSGDWD